jgi:hypothetical protein
MFYQTINGQTKSDYDFKFPEPVIGWDSLRSLIQQPENYPDILARAGVTTTIQFLINVDSLGFLTNVQAYNVKGYDTLFIPAIVRIIRSAEWKAGSIYGKYYDNQTKLFFTFYLSYQNNPQYFLISAPAHLSEKSH